MICSYTHPPSGAAKCGNLSSNCSDDPYCSASGKFAIKHWTTGGRQRKPTYKAHDAAVNLLLVRRVFVYTPSHGRAHTNTTGHAGVTLTKGISAPSFGPLGRRANVLRGVKSDNCNCITVGPPRVKQKTATVHSAELKNDVPSRT